MRPIDFCTPKPFQLEHSCSAVSQRSDRPVRLASFVARHPRATLVPEPLGSVLVRANVFFARYLTRPKTRGAGTGWLGAFRCDTRPGGISLHGAIPTSATGRFSRGGVFFCRVKSNADRLWHPCRLLRVVAWVRFSSNPDDGSEVAKTGSAGAS